MSSKYDNLPINTDYLRNLEVLSQSISTDDRISAIGYYSRKKTNIQQRAQQVSVEFETLAAMIATMSPGLDLFTAEGYVDEIIEELKKGIPADKITLYGSYGWDNIRKCCEIYYHGAQKLSGTKVVCLYHNLIEPENKNYVSVGRFEKRALLQDYSSDDSLFKISKYEYPYLAKHFQIVAERLELVPCELQSIIHKVVSDEMKNKQVSFA